MIFWSNANWFPKKFNKNWNIKPIRIDAITILTNFIINNSLKEKRFPFFKNTNKSKALNQDEMVVAIGIIINPKSLKKYILINIFKITEIKKCKMVF